MADKYIEYDPVIILVDLILLDKRAYRHLLYNCDLKPWWKLVIIIWLLESFRNLSLCNDNENNTGSLKTFQQNFDGYCNLYLILFKTAFSLTAYVVIVIIFTKIKWFFHVKNPIKYSTTHLSKAIVIGGSGKLLGLLEITWGHIFWHPIIFSFWDILFCVGLPLIQVSEYAITKLLLRLPSHRALNVCVRSHKLGKACTYTQCSKQTVSTVFRPGIGKKEVFVGIVASSRHQSRVV